jgi:predicted nucleic acid-binding protein
MVIFDSSTLILLARTEMLEVFISDFSGQVFMSERVKEEVLIKDGEETLQVAALIDGGSIGVLRVDDRKLPRKLVEDFSIDLGEAEAITLALKKKGTVIATDDKNAIRACKLLRIDFITAIAILIRAAEKKLLSKSEALLKLERLESIGRYRKSIIADARKQIRGGD